MKLTRTLIVNLVLVLLLSGVGAGLGVAYPYLYIFFGDQDRHGRDRKELDWIENDDGDAAKVRAVVGAAGAGTFTIIALLSIGSRKRHRKA